MKHFFVPTEKNNYKAYLLKIPVLLLFVVIIGSFNFLVKVDTKASTTDQEINIQNLLNAHNQERKNLNLGTLTLNDQLTQSAQAKAEAMLASNCWSHYCPDGESPWDFFDQSGYKYVLAGENLAEGYYTMNTLMNAWMNSQTHRENILNPDYEDVGFGIVTGNYQGSPNNILVVVHFGTQPTEVINDSSKKLSITSPTDGSTTNTNNTKVEGAVGNLDQVQIYLNGGLSGNADIGSGLFTYSLSGLKEGDNYIYAQSPLDFGLVKDSNVVKLTYTPAPTVLANQNISIDLKSTPDLKNFINILFIAGLAILFLLDFIVLSRTHILNKERSYAHYHFGLLLILVIIILAGGFSGNLTQAISI